MNAFQKCTFTGDAVPLYLPQKLYLKPIAQITMTVHLPTQLVGKSVSNWEVMEKLRSLISPDEFSILKVSKNTIELIRFHAELDDKNKMNKIISKIDNKLIKLKDFHDLFKVRAVEARLDFPNKHIWDSFFREAKDMNEMKPGERPDTMHISNLPIRWFLSHPVTDEESFKPSEKIFYRIFEKFGRIRHVDIPICDPYRKKMKSQISGLQTFSFDEKDFFEGYVQYKDYIGFSKAMDAFRHMKLLHKDSDHNETYTVNIKVDFDRTKHMSEGSIKRREIVRERLIRKQRQQEEKEQLQKEEIIKKLEAERQKELVLKQEKEKRRGEREENRKAKILAQLKIKDADEINDKIAKEEKKLLKAQRKLEAIRLIEELFRRVKNKQENPANSIKNSGSSDQLSKYKKSSEKEFNSRQNNLHHSIAGRVLLKTILSDKQKKRSDSSSTDTSLSLDETENDKKATGVDPKEYPLLYQYPQLQNSMYPYFTPVSLPVREQPYPSYRPRGRGFYKGAGPSRGYRRGRGNYNSNYNRNFNKNLYYPPELQAEYYRYFRRFLQDHDDRDAQSYSRSRSRSRSSYRRSRSRHRSYSRSHSRSCSRKSYSRSKSRSRSKQKSRRSCSSRRARSSHRDRNRSKSRSRSKSKRQVRSRSKESVDSSKFVSPNRLKRNPRSRSWSMPNSPNKRNNRRSWSRSS